MNQLEKHRKFIEQVADTYSDIADKLEKEGKSSYAVRTMTVSLFEKLEQSYDMEEKNGRRINQHIY